MPSTRSSTESAARRSPTVLKLGGSLLDLEDLAARLRAFLSQRRVSRPLLIVGGGRAADLARRWDAIHRLGDERAHHLALAAMHLNERLLAELLPEARIVTTREDAELAWQTGSLPILHAEAFLAAEEALDSHSGRGVDSPRCPAALALPHTWDATSDSIAAWIALRWPAETVVLLKSTTARNESRDGGGDFVDPLFPAMAAKIPHVEFVDLRSFSGNESDD